MEVIILGMHRSGTSLASGIINKLGVFGGDEYILNRGGEWNPKGYWEFRKLNQINNQILATLGKRWDRIAGLDEVLLRNHKSEQISNLCNGLSPELEAFEKHGDWAIKDPRMCLLLPVWKRFLKKPVAVIVVRDPVEVAISLNKRNQMPLVVGIALWEAYTKSALKHSQGMPRIFVDYNALLENPENQISILQQALAGLGVQISPDTTHALELVDKSLYRSHGNGISTNGLLNLNQAEHYEAIRSGIATDDDISQGGLETLSLYERASPEISWWGKKMHFLTEHLKREK